MDTWTNLTEFFACGLLVLPATLGVGLDSFEVFALTLGLMQLLLIAVSIGGPTVAAPGGKDDRSSKQ
jgi:hypothetical protein